MEINQIKCKACGAPVSFQTDADIIKCSYCGTFLYIERGEEKVDIKVLLDDTQSEILPDGTPITQQELNRRKMRQEIKNALHKLSQIQDEIRLFLQAPPSSIKSLQLRSLRSDEYSALDQVRLLGIQYSVPTPDDIEAFLRYAQQEKTLIQQEIEALQNSDLSDIPQIIQALTERSKDLDKQCLPIKVEFIKQHLTSFQKPLPSSATTGQIKEYLDILALDEDKIKRSEYKPEFNIVLNEINKRKSIWEQKLLDLSREQLTRSLKSLKFDQVSNEYEALTEYLRCVYKDLLYLSDNLTNVVEYEFYYKLLNEKIIVQKRIKSLGKAGKISKQISKLFAFSPNHGNEDYIPDILNNPTKRPGFLFNRPGKKSLGLGLAFAFLINICFCISGFFFISTLLTIFPNMNIQLLMGIFMLSITIGYIFGARIFSLYAMPDLTIRGVFGLPVRTLTSNKVGDVFEIPFIARLLVGIHVLNLFFLIGICGLFFIPDKGFSFIIILISPIFSLLAILRTKVTSFLP